jgi:hypothetical protein
VSDTSDDANYAELLDDDKLPPAYPPDEPLGVDEYGVTAAEEAVQEPLAERVAREEPDLVPGNGDRAYGDPVGTLVAPESAVDELDVTAEEVAREVTAAEPPALDDGDLAFGDSTTRDVAQERVDARPAEEAAMHVTPSPPMGDGDDYV